MKQEDIKQVAVIGGGLMGFGIALEFARFGYPVSMYNTREATSKQAMQNIREALDLMVKAELITASDADAAHKRITPTTDMKDAASGADYVVESVLDKLALKQQIFAQLDEFCPPSTILATNTTALRVTSIAAKTKHPERVILTHYFEPPHFMPLVEVGGGEKTDRSLLEPVAQMLKKMHKRVVIINVDESGGIGGTRLQRALSQEIHHMVDVWGYTPQMIDDIVTYGFGRRLAWTGTFQRNDLIGLDFMYNSATERGEEPWKPIKERVERGDLGMKSGRGFYEWPPEVLEKFMRRYHMGLLWLLKADLDNDDI